MIEKRTVYRDLWRKMLGKDPMEKQANMGG
jgi:hypothetical protein